MRRMGWGLGWGLAMGLVSVFLGAGGHGIFLPLLIFSAPVSLLGTGAAWIGCIPMGGLLAALLQRRELPVVLAAHYAAAVVVAVGSGREELPRLVNAPSSFVFLFVLAMLLYVGGHILLWRTWWAVPRDGLRRTVYDGE